MHCTMQARIPWCMGYYVQYLGWNSIDVNVLCRGQPRAEAVQLLPTAQRPGAHKESSNQNTKLIRLRQVYLSMHS